MKMKANRTLTIIISLYIVGIIASFFIVSPSTINLFDHDVTIWGIAKTFCLNYWYLFIMWILGFSLFGFIINLFIVFFRGFIFGVLIVYLIRINFQYLMVLTIVELIVFIPLFISLGYYSIMLSFCSFRNINFKADNYPKLLTIITVVTFIYSLILEIVGGTYA